MYSFLCRACAAFSLSVCSITRAGFSVIFVAHEFLFRLLVSFFVLLIRFYRYTDEYCSVDGIVLFFI
jgi:hypothetical protein